MKFTNTLLPFRRGFIVPDLIAGLIVAIMLVPQAVAYAFLAGLPPQAGLFASLLPLLAYAALGTSPTLAVGPVAIISLMTLSSLTGVVAPDNSDYPAYAALLAGMTATWLFIFFIAGLGSWTSFISHSVISGFTSAAAIVIIISQLKYFTALDIPRGGAGWEPLVFTAEHWKDADSLPFIIGLLGIALLIFWQRIVPRVTYRLPIHSTLGTLLNRAGPLVLISSGIVMTLMFNMDLRTVGAVPTGLPDFSIPDVMNLNWQALLLPSAILALIIFLESLSIANTMGREQHVRVKPNQEILALGAANAAAAITQAMPVAGGFGRSMVMISAGARSQLASVFTFGFMAFVCLVAGSWFEHLPVAALGVIIVVATWPLFRWQDGWNAWKFQRGDGLVWLITFAGVLAMDAESGIIAGVTLSLIIYLRRTSQPHIAEIGRIHNTELFRNVLRHKTERVPDVMLIRVDENLYFANSDYLVDYVLNRINQQEESVSHVVLVGSAINHIDYSGLEALELLHENLAEQNIQLHLAEFKGPVMDQLDKTHLLQKITPGRSFFTISDALQALSPEYSKPPEDGSDDFYTI